MNRRDFLKNCGKTVDSLTGMGWAILCAETNNPDPQIISEEKYQTLIAYLRKKK